MKQGLSQYKTFLLIVVSIIALIVTRTVLAANGNVPRLNDLFTTLILAGSLAVWSRGYRQLHRFDWLAAFSLGAVVGVTMVFATLFTPYPFFGITTGNWGEAWVRGLTTTVAMLGGLTMMRQGGPVQFLAARGEWRSLWRSLAVGLAAGVPLAAVNVAALQLTQGKAIQWQDPLAAMRDALQPGIIEEVVYRFAFLGLLWLVLRKDLPTQAAWLAALLAMVVHTALHFDELFIQAPLVALGMGLAMIVLWGLPLTYLALRRGLESAIAFHWIQDAARFWAGF